MKRDTPVTVHGAVRFYAPAPVRAKRVPPAHGTAARPPSNKVMEPNGHPAHCRRQLWMAGCRYNRGRL